jgi:hypothetical protein
MKTFLAITGVLLLAVTGAGCSNNSTTTSPTTTTTSPTSVTFASQVTVKGGTSRTFTMSTAGTVKVTMTSLGNGTQVAGLGVGIPATSAPCSLALSVVTGPSGAPQIVTSADPGTYCVQVYDTGTLTGDTDFSVTVEHP